MNKTLLKKKVRHYSARLGILKPLRSLVFKLRGGSGLDSQIKFFSRFVDKNKHVFDVGANRGQSSEVFTKLGARVTAFEPQADLHEEIRQICGKKSRLTIKACGLGGAEESRTLHITSYDQAASLRDDWEGDRIGTKTIEISTLDRQIELHGLPDYCKIDVEGWELEVLSGLSQPIPIISFEYHTSGAELDRAEAVLKRLAEIGDYHCDVKTSIHNDFVLNQFIPIKDFISEFRSIVAKPDFPGYGDVFCLINP